MAVYDQGHHKVKQLIEYKEIFHNYFDETAFIYLFRKNWIKFKDIFLAISFSLYFAKLNSQLNITDLQ